MSTVTSFNTSREKLIVTSKMMGAGSSSGLLCSSIAQAMEDSASVMAVNSTKHSLSVIEDVTPTVPEGLYRIFGDISFDSQVQYLSATDRTIVDKFGAYATIPSGAIPISGDVTVIYDPNDPENYGYGIPGFKYDIGTGEVWYEAQPTKTNYFIDFDILNSVTKSSNTLMETTDLTTHHAYSYLAGILLANTKYTISFEVKGIGRQALLILCKKSDGSYASASINFVNKTTRAVDTAFGDISFSDKPNGFTEVTIEFNSGAGTSNNGLINYLNIMESDTSVSYAGDATKGLIINNKQTEVGTKTNYIPTTTNVTERLEGSLAVPTINNWNPLEGLVLVDVSSNSWALETLLELVSLEYPSVLTGLLRLDSTTIKAFDGSTEQIHNFADLSSATRIKIAIKYGFGKQAGGGKGLQFIIKQPGQAAIYSPELDFDGAFLNPNGLLQIIYNNKNPVRLYNIHIDSTLSQASTTLASL